MWSWSSAIPFLLAVTGRSESNSREDLLMKERGVVKWFNAAKGYGFIQRPAGEDLFVHFSAIRGDGYRSLEEGATAEFTVKTGAKGHYADEVVVVA